MYRIRLTTMAIMVAILTMLCVGAWAQDVPTFSPSDLDQIFAPIALYSDPLLAQILPAATFPDELSQAQNFIQDNSDPGLIDNQDWDVSVQAVAHYPSVLNKMVDDPDWTVAIGQAYVNQPDDVMASIQRLRGKARLMGYLSTNKYQRTYYEGSYLRIVPVDPEYIYVPNYDPDIVYVRRYNNNSLNSALAFGIGLLIGSWLDRDVDWGRHRVYYHGWNGGGWISNSRSHVDYRNNRYVNDRYRDQPIDINRTVINVNINNYRTEVKKRASSSGYRIPSNQLPPSQPTYGRKPSPTTKTPVTRPNYGTPRTNQGSTYTAPVPKTTKSRTTTPRTSPTYGTPSGNTYTPNVGKRNATPKNPPTVSGRQSGRNSSGGYVTPDNTRGNAGSGSSVTKPKAPAKTAPAKTPKSKKSGHQKTDQYGNPIN